jgi:hypothetical protein
MSTFRPPVAANSVIGWSWYCHLAFRGGFQQAPAAALQACGAGGAADATAPANVEAATTANTMATARLRCVGM